MLLSNASPREYSDSLYLFGHLDGTIRQKFACSLCRDHISSPCHAIKTKFIGTILHSAPAGSPASRQFAERSSYSLQVHIIVAVIFLEHSEWNDQSKGRPPHSSVYSERCHLCEKHLDRRRDEESEVMLWKIYQTKHRVKVMRNYGRRRRSSNNCSGSHSLQRN